MEAIPVTQPKASPFTQNFFEADLQSEKFTTELLAAMGDSVKQVKSHCKNSNQVLQTFYNHEVLPCEEDIFKPFTEHIQDDHSEEYLVLAKIPKLTPAQLLKNVLKTEKRQDK